MGPDDTGGDLSHDVVCTVMEIEPGVAAPMVKPLIVTVNAAVRPIVAPDVARRTAVLLVDAQMMFKPRTLLDTKAGLIASAKKIGGYVSVMEPPGGTSRGTVKANVTEALALPAIRSDGAMAKVTKVNNDSDRRTHDPVGPISKKGQTQATGTRNVRPLCITAISKDDRVEGMLA